MALRPCKECGRRISSEAPHCPNCGVPSPALPPPSGLQLTLSWLIPGVLGVFFFSWVLNWGLFPDDDPEEPSAPRSTYVVPELDALVQKSADQLFVVNNDPFSWRDCTVRLNSSGLSSGYSTRVARIDPGERVSVGLAAFTRSGERFNPFTHAVERVYVGCTSPAGFASWSGLMN